MSSRRATLVAVALALLPGVAVSLPGTAQAVPSDRDARFSVPGLHPDYGRKVRDYVVRCRGAPVTVTVHTSGRWEAAVGNSAYRAGDFSESVALEAGEAVRVTFRETGRAPLFRYHVRCLPEGFPRYTYKRYGPVTPRFFSADLDFVSPPRRYAMIFDDHGVPVWWIHLPVQGTRVLSNGNVLWFNRDPARPGWEIRRLDGSLVKTLGTVGYPADAHDLQPLDDGGYLAGAYVTQSRVDTSAYGGSSDADVQNTELQQVGPDGRLVWSWKSQNHISLSETGRHWPGQVNTSPPEGYDILHWNSVEPAGGSVIASFRHLDAVYKIRKSTGAIVWKLGGTRTPRSLRVIGDSRPQVLGAQHDARLLSDGTVTVFDNRGNLPDRRPRAVRFRIADQKRTATLVQSITDPSVTSSNCCGSARRLGNGDWLIDWGLNRPIGGYRADGERTFLLTFQSNAKYHFSYRAEPVPSGAVSVEDLRRAMNAMHPAG